MGRRNQFLSKHVREEATQGFPEPTGDEFVVQLVRSRGGNTMECKLADGAEVLCWLPSKLNKVRAPPPAPMNARLSLIRLARAALACGVRCREVVDATPPPPRQVVWAQRGDYMIVEPSSEVAGKVSPAFWCLFLCLVPGRCSKVEVGSPNHNPAWATRLPLGCAHLVGIAFMGMCWVKRTV